MDAVVEYLEAVVATTVGVMVVVALVNVECMVTEEVGTGWLAAVVPMEMVKVAV